ncbi:MAG: hypothetical protein MMC23_007767 [Stictis urceolatum]|nr:hypothetical protein [Stictis urceolata]
MAPIKIATRALGKNGPQVGKLGFGAMGLSAFYAPKLQPDEERLAVLDRAYELGATNWDTSDVYGDNEILIGNWFKKTGKRNDIFLASKFAAKVEDGKMNVYNDPQYVRSACDLSLKRLGVEVIDLYYCHRFNGKVPVEDTVSAMAELVKEGKVKYLGLSECSAETLRRAHKVHPISAVQLEYSPWTLDIEYPKTNLLKTCRELGVAVVAYSPLGRGFLTGAYKSADDFEEGDMRKTAERFDKENFPKNLELVQLLKNIGARKGCTSGQLTLAWLMAQGEDIIPIPGTKKIKYLEENMGALDVKLSDDEIKEIRAAIEKCGVAGERYNAAQAAMTYMDTPPKA